MSILDMAAAMIIAVLAGTGIGGGGLYVIWLTAVKHLPQSEAQCINLLFFMSAAVTALPFHLKKRTLPLKFIVPCALLGAVGTVSGGFLRSFLNENTLRTLFGILLILAGVRNFFTKNRQKTTKRDVTGTD